MNNHTNPFGHWITGLAAVMVQSCDIYRKTWIFRNFSKSRMNIFLQKNIQKHFKCGFLYVLDDSEMIWEKNIFSIFRTKFLDFGSLWRPYRKVNLYILLVILSLPVDQQLCQRILLMHYWFGCSDSPKLPISSKNAIFAICGHFWAWPLWATFWISIFKLSYYTFPMIEFMYLAP